MELQLIREHAPLMSYTLGKLFIDGYYFCDTLEPQDRGLTSSMSLTDIKKIKVRGRTAVPVGQYRVILAFSPRFSVKSFYRSLGGLVPRLLNVPGYDGILIHCGNTVEDTSGCILVGDRYRDSQLINSRATYTELIRLLSSAPKKEGFKIKIEDKKG